MLTTTKPLCSAFAAYALAVAAWVNPVLAQSTLQEEAGLSWSTALQATDADARPIVQRETFLRHGTDWLTIGLGLSAGTQDITEENVHAAYSYFVANRVEIVGELSLRLFQQPGKDVFAVNPAVVFRWHFYVSEDEKWTAYADLGLGLMLSTDDVPETATSINLTPRAGLGITRRIDDSARLQIGLRWSHVSNGRMFGEDDNPGHDGAMLYAGMIFDF